MADAAALPPAPAAPVAATPPAGLTSAQVAERRARGLTNAGGERTSRSVAEILRANILTRFNFLLGALLAVILVAGQPQDALFGIVLVTNALIGIAQELRAKRTLDRLAVLSAPRVRVIRDGTPQDIAVADLVADDLVDLRAGDQLVADGVVRASTSLEADESLLTGESEPVDKRAGDRLLSGSFVVAGSGGYQATGVGADAYAQARRPGAAVRAGALGADRRHQPDPALRHVGDRTGGRTAGDQPVARPPDTTGGCRRDGRRAGRHGPAGPGAADQRRVRRGRGHAGPAPGAGAAASRGRGPGPGGRGVPGQDRHLDRRDRRVRQPDPARGPGASRGGTRSARG